MIKDVLSNSFKRTYGQRPRGFAIITVVAMIGLVAACFVVLAEVFSYQLKLTNTTIARLQVDLLLSAGTHCAIADLADGNVPAKPWTVDLPAALAKEGGQLSITAHQQAENEISFTVNAAFSNLHSHRVLEFQRSARHWRLIQVTIPGSSFGMASFEPPA
ncbi:MAG: hypothetical protein ACP5I8_10505 [Phycisphaerae bacterium]